MGDNSAGWKRLLEASWSRAKQQAQEVSADVADDTGDLVEDAAAVEAVEEAAAAVPEPTPHEAARRPQPPPAGGLGSLLSRILGRPSSSGQPAVVEEPPGSAPEPEATEPAEDPQGLEPEAIDAPDEAMELDLAAAEVVADELGEGEDGPLPIVEIDDEGEIEEVQQEAGAEEAAAAELVVEAEPVTEDADLADAEMPPAPAVPVSKAAAAAALPVSKAAAAAALQAAAVPGIPKAPGQLAALGPRPKWGAPPPRRAYVVENAINASSFGLAFRKSKQMGDIDADNVVEWGSTVEGADGGDGWLSVTQNLGDRFLPFVFEGVRVLVPTGPEPTPAKASMAAPSSTREDGSPSPAAGELTRSHSGQRYYNPKNQADAAELQRKVSFAGVQEVPTQPSLKRQPSFGWVSPIQPNAKRGPWMPPMPRADGLPDLRSVVVSFGAVGGEFAEKILKKNAAKGDKVFDWEGVRRCVRHLRFQSGLMVIGVVFENWWGKDRDRGSVGIPMDVRAMCAMILETPRLTGEKHKVAEKEMAIKCAWRRNCRFIETDTGDWRQEMIDERCRAWLEESQEQLQIRYFFDANGAFRLLDA